MSKTLRSPDLRLSDKFQQAFQKQVKLKGYTSFKENCSCFLCGFNRTATIGNNNLQQNQNDLQTQSLKSICRYFGIDFNKTAQPKAPIKNHLNVALCPPCFEVVQKFGELYEVLEEIQMEIGYQVDLIQGRLQKQKLADNLRLADKLAESNTLSDDSKIATRFRNDLRKSCKFINFTIKTFFNYSKIQTNFPLLKFNF